jgi:hypothetical protein
MDVPILLTEASNSFGLVLFLYLLDVLAIVWYFTEQGAEEQSQ